MIITDFLLENGVGQNLTAGVIVFALGVVWSRTKYWPLHAIHRQLAALHDRHDQHAKHLDGLNRSLAELHEKLDRLPPPSKPRAKPPRPRPGG